MGTKAATRKVAAFLTITYKVAAQGFEECSRVFEWLLETTVAHGVLFVCKELRRFGFPI